MTTPGVGGFAHMQTGPVDGGTDALARIGETVHDDWAATARAVLAAEGGIGAGRLAAAFRPGYDSAARHARAAADPVPDQYRDLAAVGRASVRMYLTADHNSALAMPR